MKTKCSMLVIYDNPASREHAVKACGRLVERFWTQSEFDVSWWCSDMLARPEVGAEAAEKAIQADLLVFALAPDADLLFSIRDWIETWLKQRGDREGALIDLMATDPATREAPAERSMYLRHAAHRAGMDYLTREPQNISWAMSESLDSFNARAHSMTSVLDEILHTHPIPPSPPLLDSAPAS